MRQRAVVQVRQQHRRDARVVVDHLALGEPRRRGRGPCRGWRAAACGRPPRPRPSWTPWRDGTRRRDAPAGRRFSTPGGTAEVRVVGGQPDGAYLLRAARGRARLRGGLARLRLLAALPLPSAAPCPSRGQAASSAAIRSGTFVGSSGGGWTVISSPCGLALDQLEHALAVLVVVLLGLEVGESDSISCCAISSSRSDASTSSSGRSSSCPGVDDLVGEEHRRHRSTSPAGADRDEVLLGADHDAGDRHLARPRAIASSSSR